MTIKKRKLLAGLLTAVMGVREFSYMLGSYWADIWIFTRSATLSAVFFMLPLKA